ncbi:MAG: DUF2569 family protein [Candidatus Pacearchaeota archaeon]
MKKRRTNSSKLTGISGWLLAALIFMFLFALESFWMFAIRVFRLIFLNLPLKGIIGNLISIIILLLVSIFAIYSIYLILKKRKKAVKISIKALYLGILFSFWYDIIGLFLYEYNFTETISGITMFIINFAILYLVLCYFKKSKRVKNTLRK